jgi:hypothetical protein
MKLLFGIHQFIFFCPFSNRLEVSAGMGDLQPWLWDPNRRYPLPVNRSHVGMAHQRFPNRVDAMILSIYLVLP